ncbi:MAG: hypothetical protein R2695_12670 [Acidimicrobiales bacterium]
MRSISRTGELQWLGHRHDLFVRDHVHAMLVDTADGTTGGEHR